MGTRGSKLALAQAERACASVSAGTSEESILSTWRACFSSTARHGSRFFSKPAKGPVWAAMRALMEYAWPHMMAVMAAATARPPSLS